MKRSIRTLTCITIFAVVVFGIAMMLPVQQVLASEESHKADTNYINVTTKYLYLGVSGKNTYDFNINKKVLKEVKEYRWYIAEEKGNPKAIRLDSKTGIVTAKSAGTAYIRCEITLADKTVVNPEAKIIVINNITKVEINNIPENKCIGVNEAYDFNEAVLDTTVGKKVRTNGITRWEIKNDTAEVGVATEDGVVIPRKAGEFSIRAVCFQKLQDYEMWLMNKEARAKNITAASGWVTISAIASEGEATTQEQLDSLLSDVNMKKITVSAEAEAGIVIPKGDYSDKTLIVKAQNIDISNHGTFKLITFYSAFDIKWTENGVKNSLEVYNSIIRFDITDKAQVKSIKFGKTDDSTPYKDIIDQYLYTREESLINTFISDSVLTSVNLAHLSVNGRIEKIDVTVASALYLSGAGKIDRVIICDTAVGARFAASMATDLETNADCFISVLNGAEDINLNITTGSTVKIENLSSSSVNVYHGESNFTFLSSGYIYSLPFTNGIFSSLSKAKDCSIIKLYPSGPINVTASSLVPGQKLWFSNLYGNFSYNSISIPGTLSWTMPEIEVGNDGFFRWKFTPVDTDHYAIVYGYVKVEVH